MINQKGKKILCTIITNMVVCRAILYHNNNNMSVHYIYTYPCFLHDIVTIESSSFLLKWIKKSMYYRLMTQNRGGIWDHYSYQSWYINTSSFKYFFILVNFSP